MITTSAHDIHRLLEDSNLFNPFQRQPATNLSSAYRSSDLLSLPPSQYRTLSSLNSIPPSVPQYKSRAASEILQNQHPRRDKSSVEAEAIDKWFENIQRYEQMLEEVADASLDQGFKDELQQINQWFRCRSDAERTAAFYTVLQNASQIQIRFLITVLQQLAKREPYPAGQDTNSEIYQASSSYQPSSLFNAKSSSSVISAGSNCDSAAARRRQQLYPFSSSNRYCTVTSSSRQPHHKLTTTTTTASAISEPDDVRRRQYLHRDFFSTASRPLELSNPGPLYEKALAARAQLQAFNSGSISGSSGGSTTSGSSTTSSSIISSSSLSSSDHNAGNTGGLFSSPPPRLRSSCSTTDISPNATTNKSLFIKSNDWPFPLTKNNHTLTPSTTTTTTLSSSSSSVTRDSSAASWAFGSLRASSNSSVMSSGARSNKEKKDVLPWSILEEEPLAPTTTTTTTTTMNNPSTTTSKRSTGISTSLSALEQAQARLRQQEKRMMMNTSQPPPPAPSSSYSSRMKMSHTGTVTATAARIPSPNSLPSLTEGVVTTHAPYDNLTVTTKKGPLLTPPPPSMIEDGNSENKLDITPSAAAAAAAAEQEHEEEEEEEEKPLTGLARRRKRSSAARALKDKIAAETVDFELMKDVQMWLRTLRLHKYGHAFIGLNWKQVIRMSDQQMIDAGVNTVGARRKLLKVFENVQRHCIEHNIEY